MAHSPRLQSLTEFMESMRELQRGALQNEPVQLTVDGVPEAVAVHQWDLTPETRPAIEGNFRQLAILHGKPWVQRMFGFMFFGIGDTWASADGVALFIDAASQHPSVQSVMFEDETRPWVQRFSPNQRLDLAIQACEIARTAPGFRCGFFNLKTLLVDQRGVQLVVRDFLGVNEKYAEAHLSGFNAGYVRGVYDAARPDQPSSMEHHYDYESQFSLGVVIWQLLLGARAYMRAEPAWGRACRNMQLPEYVAEALKTDSLDPAGFEPVVLRRILSAVRKLNAANPNNRPNVREVQRALEHIRCGLDAPGPSAPAPPSDVRRGAMDKLHVAFADTDSLLTLADTLIEVVQGNPATAFRVASEMLHLVTDPARTVVFTDLLEGVLRAAVAGTLVGDFGCADVVKLAACLWTLLRRAGLDTAQHRLLFTLARDLFRVFPSDQMARALVAMSQEFPSVPVALLLDVLQAFPEEGAVAVPALQRLLGAVCDEEGVVTVLETRAGVLVDLVRRVASQAAPCMNSVQLVVFCAPLRILRKLFRLVPRTYGAIVAAALAGDLVQSMTRVLQLHGVKSGVFDQCVATMQALVVPFNSDASFAAAVASVAPLVVTLALQVRDPLLAVSLVGALTHVCPQALPLDTQLPFLELLRHLARQPAGACGEGSDVGKMLSVGIDALHRLATVYPERLSLQLYDGLSELWHHTDVSLATQNQLLGIVSELCRGVDDTGAAVLLATFWELVLAALSGWTECQGMERLDVILSTMARLGTLPGTVPDVPRAVSLLCGAMLRPDFPLRWAVFTMSILAAAPAFAKEFVDTAVHAALVSLVVCRLSTFSVTHQKALVSKTMETLWKCLENHPGQLVPRHTSVTEVSLVSMQSMVSSDFNSDSVLWMNAVREFLGKLAGAPSPWFAERIRAGVTNRWPAGFTDALHQLLKERAPAV